MSPVRLLRNVLLGICAVVGAVAALVGGWWLYATEPWYDGVVIRQLRSGTRDAPGRDETPRLAPLFPEGMTADSARSLLDASGFSCTQTQAEGGKDMRLRCFRETHDSFICGGTYMVEVTIDRDRRLTARSGHSYYVCG